MSANGTINVDFYATGKGDHRGTANLRGASWEWSISRVAGETRYDVGRPITGDGLDRFFAEVKRIMETGTIES